MPSTDAAPPTKPQPRDLSSRDPAGAADDEGDRGLSRPGRTRCTCAQLPKPSVDDVPDGRGVLVKVLRVGVDGTDKEINAAEYGAAPPGYDFLVTGHESFGRGSRRSVRT